MGSAYGELSRIRLADALECGMRGCDEPASSGLLEPDAKTHGLWRLLPICDSCSTQLVDSSAITSEPDLRQPGDRE
ncbi:MAG TPA: hypothetical protein VF808_11145 [Ktedonobacterales bacterium]